MNPSLLDLAIVTCVHNYGRYLAEWTAGILALQRRPKLVGIAHSGLSADAAATEAARLRLQAAGFEVSTASLPGETNIGKLRNAAVALSEGCEWVMHFDADDKLMPHALDDVAALMPHADVVALGYERSGDLAAGPRQRTKLYRSSQGPSALANPTPCSGVSPFRRALWEKSPYPTDQVGGWDTSLWRGFAHLGARFVPTKRPCFWYHQHADSVFNVRRKAPLSWQATLTGQQLRSRWAGEKGVSVIISLAERNEPIREAALRVVKAHYAKHHPTWQLLEGRAVGNPWIKGNAVAAALEKAKGRVLVVADADCIVSPEAMEEAARLVNTGEAPWVVPHGLVHRLSRTASAAWLGSPPAGGKVPRPAARQLDRPAYQGFAGGGVFVVSRPAYVASGGIPRTFVGWGAEDEAMALIFDTLLGAHKRLSGDLIHFWHPPQVGRQRPIYRRNRMVYQRLVGAARDAETLWACLSGFAPAPKPRQPLIAGRAAAIAAARLRAARGSTLAVSHRPLAPRPQLAAARLRAATLGPEARMHDDFARRRLAKARQRLEQEMKMGAGRDIALAHRLQRQQQRQRNIDAVRDAEARRARATNTAKMLRPQVEDKMDRGPREDKGGVTIVKPPASPPVDNLNVVAFASKAAEKLARERGLTVRHFSGRRAAGKDGFTISQVRGIAA